MLLLLLLLHTPAAAARETRSASLHASLLFLVLVQHTPAVAAAKRRKRTDGDARHFRFVESGRYHEMLGKNCGSGVAIAYVNNDARTYLEFKAALNEAALALQACLPREQILMLRTRKDAMSQYIVQQFHEDHKACSRGPLLRARQVDMDIPLLAYFRTERAVPQPFAWHSGTENWTAPALVEWAETVCALHRTLPVDTTVAEQLTGRGDREL